MLFFTILTYASVYASMAFAALCLATGLYYVAELAEEYSVLAKKLLEYSLFTIVGIHVILWLFDPFPLRYIAIGIISHLVYYQLLKSFPFVSFTSVGFILSCVCFFASHYAWYHYFTDPWTPAFDFYQLFGFFFTCVWLLPGALFITLNMSDNSLPGGVYLSGQPQQTRDILSSSPLSSSSSSNMTVRGGKRHNNLISWIHDWLSSFLSKSKRRQSGIPSHLGGTNNFGGLDNGFIIGDRGGKHL